MSPDKTKYDLLLLRSLKEGKQRAFNKVYALYYEKLSRYLLNYSQNYAQIEDVVQDTFITLWNKRKEIHIETSLQSYLYRAAHNKLMDEYRRHKKRDSFLNDYYYTAIMRADSQKEDHKAEQLKTLKNCIKKLPKRCREVFMESKLSQKTNQQIAADFKISVKTIEGHITKGYRLLKECIKGTQYED